MPAEPQTPLATDQDYLATIGRRVRLTRAQRGITRAMLAEGSGVSARYLAQLEAGTGNVSILVLRRIAHGLGVSPGELLGDVEPAPGPARLHGLLVALPPSRLEEAAAVLLRHFGPAPSRSTRDRIALIGLRGAGKSTLGRALAERLGLAFYELDREIERDAGMELAELFQIQGQAGYRRLERAALERLIADREGAVVATGGSIVAEAATYGLLLAHFYTVRLRASPDEHMARVIGQGDLRPMADSKRAMADLRAILDSRQALYERADAQLDTGGRSVEESLADLLALVRGPRS